MCMVHVSGWMEIYVCVAHACAVPILQMEKNKKNMIHSQARSLGICLGMLLAISDIVMEMAYSITN